MRKKRFSVREHGIIEQRMKRSPLKSARVMDRHMRIDAERSRGVLPPIIRGCSLPRWLRDI